VVRVEGLCHHDEVRRLLGIALSEGFAGLGQELIHLRLALGRFFDLTEEVSRLVMAGEIEEDLFDLGPCTLEISVVEIFHRFHQ